MTGVGVDAQPGPGTDETPDARRWARPARSPWVGMLVVLVGGFASSLNLTVIGVTLPSIAADVHSSPGGLSVDWVVTGYLVGVVVALPATGWLSDRFGRGRVYAALQLAFGAGALVCLAAGSMPLLVGGRVLQGLGGGALMPVGMALVYDLFPPHRRGTALGVWGIAVMAAPAMGPPLGGWVVSVASWRWVFVTFVVVGLVGAVLTSVLLPAVGHREARRFDGVGMALAAVAFVALIVGARQLDQWGPTSAVSLITVAVVLASGGLLVRHALRSEDPIIDVRMFRVRTFVVAMSSLWLYSGAQFAQLTFLPIELQVVRGLDAQQVGLVLAAPAFGAAATMPLAGWLADRVGSRVPVCLGSAAAAAGHWQLAHLHPQGSMTRVVGALVACGLGTGLVFLASNVAAMNALPGRFLSRATSVLNLGRQLAGAMSVAVLSALVAAHLGTVAPAAPDVARAQAAYDMVFRLSFGLAALNILVGLALPATSGRRDRSLGPPSERPRTA